MERDLMVMIYGAIMGVAGSILTSIVTAVFQLWPVRREFNRRQTLERDRQLKQIHLPTHEEARGSAYPGRSWVCAYFCPS